MRGATSTPTVTSTPASAAPPRTTGRGDRQRASTARTDRALARDIAEALAAEHLLHPMDDLFPPPIRVEVSDGAVTLRGNSTSRVAAERLALVAGRVPGVRAVRDQLTADEEVDAVVTRALDTDPRVGHVGIQVDVREGVVLLSGAVPTPDAAQAAVAVAAGAAGVRAVAPRLDVAGAAQPDHHPTVALPRVGSVVATPAGPIGELRLVVIDPRARRVTHLVVAGSFPPESELTPGQPPEERLVLVPVEAIGLMTHDLVRLDLTAAGVGVLPLFDETAVDRPARDWQPPIDYRWEEVRVSVSRRRPRP